MADDRDRGLSSEDASPKAAHAEISDAKISDAKTADAEASVAEVAEHHVPDPKAGEAIPSERAPVGRSAVSASEPSPIHSEWTASDRRGPLGSETSEDVPPNTEASPTVQPRQSEWTASDERGPLSAADDGDIERVVPAHEADPVGSEDDVFSASARSDASGSEPPAEPAPAWLGQGAVRPAHNAASPSPWPVLMALIVGAIIGAAAAALVFAAQTNNGDDRKIAALAARVDALEGRPEQNAGASGLKTALADLQSRVSALQKDGGGKAAAFDPAPLQTKIDAVQAQVADLQKQTASAAGLETKLGGLEAAVAGAQKQASTAQSGLEAVQAQQKSLEGKVGMPALAVVVDSLVQQIAQGQSYNAQVDALTSLGADPTKVAILKQFADKGVPSAGALSAKLTPLADQMIAADQKVPADAGFVDRLKYGMSRLVSVRRADDTSGTDVRSRIALIQASLAHDNVVAAFEGWNALPEDAKKKSEAWGALAKTSADAMAAARGLQHDAIGTLGTRKS